MKKSKFLKKSLAMLLALMLVVAMIPLSAAAEAADPTVYVDNQLAKLSGTTYSVEATKTTVDITWVKQADVELVAVDKNGNEITALTDINLENDATKSGDVYTLGLRTKVAQSEDDQDLTKDYTLNITVKETVLSNDTSIKALTNKDGELANMTNYTIGGNVITINFAFGATLPSSLSGDDFIATNSNATKSVVSFTDKKGTLTVTAQDQSTKTYTVELKSDAGITSFTVPEQTEETKIDGTEITIKVPYGYKTDKVVPTFKLADGILALTTSTNGYDEDVVTSGETEIDLTSKVTLYAWTSKSVSVAVTVELDVPTQNPEGVLKTVKVGGSNEVTVSGNTISVEMPAGFDFGKDGPVAVTGTVSENANVAVSAQNIKVEKAADGEYSLSGVSVSGKTFVITVKSEDGKTTNNYTVNLTVAASAEAKLNDFSVKYTENGKETVYSASNGTLTLPYAAKAELDQYIVYVQASTGATVKYNNGSENVVNGTTNLKDAGLIDNNKITLKVTGSDGTAEHLHHHREV